MNDSKIVMDIKELEIIDGKKNYEVLVLNENWGQYFNNIYEILVKNNASHLKLKGFRNNSKTPLVLFEIKYQEYFDKLKNESLQYTLAMINMNASSELKMKTNIKSFKIEENTNNLIIILEEILEKENTTESSSNTKNNEEIIINDDNIPTDENESKKTKKSTTKKDKAK